MGDARNIAILLELLHSLRFIRFADKINLVYFKTNYITYTALIIKNG